MRLLLLQGPFGGFSKHAIKNLSASGNKVFKISFNGGDYLSGGAFGDKFTQPPHKFRLYLKNYIKQNSIEGVILFGDCRFYHRIAVRLCNKMSIPIAALEEGYLRPNYITVESDGLNANSKANFLEPVEEPKLLTDFNDSHKTKNLLLTKTPHVILYYIAKFLMRPWFIYYKHHRSYSIFKETFYWVRSARRRMLTSFREQKDIRKITAQPYFFVPLQVHNDSQIIYHSDFESIEAFIDEVVSSFARFAPPDTALVLKHHPQDLGFKKYSKYIKELATHYNIVNRVVVLNDFSVPNLLRYCEGCVTINSTVGLSALIHSKPVIALGSCFYDLKGITHGEGLDRFWSHPEASKEDLKRTFFHNIRVKTQVNGSYYDYSQKNIDACVQMILKVLQKKIKRVCVATND